MAGQAVEVGGDDRADPERCAGPGVSRVPVIAAIRTRNAARPSPYRSAARAPAAAASRSSSSGNASGRLAATQGVLRHRLEHLARERRVAPRDPALGVDLDELGVRARPEEDRASPRRDPAVGEQGGSRRRGSRTPRRASRRIEPAVGALGRRGADARHDQDRPVVDLGQVHEGRGPGQVIQPRRRQDVRDGDEPDLRGEHAGGDEVGRRGPGTHALAGLPSPAAARSSPTSSTTSRTARTRPSRRAGAPSARRRPVETGDRIAPYRGRPRRAERSRRRGPRAAAGRGYWSSRRPARWPRSRSGRRPMVRRRRRRSRSSSWSRFFLAFAPARSDPLLLSLVRGPWSVVGLPVLRDALAIRVSVQRTTDNGPRTRGLMPTPRPAAFEPNPTLAAGTRAHLLARPRAEAGLGESGLGGADRLPGGDGRRADLPGARTDAGRRPVRPGRELPPAAGVPRGPAGGRPDVDLPRRRRAALASGRVLAVLRRPRRADRPAGDRAGGRGPAERPRFRGRPAARRAAGDPASAAGTVRPGRPDRLRPGAPEARSSRSGWPPARRCPC